MDLLISQECKVFVFNTVASPYRLFNFSPFKGGYTNTAKERVLNLKKKKKIKFFKIFLIWTNEHITLILIGKCTTEQLGRMYFQFPSLTT